MSHRVAWAAVALLLVLPCPGAAQDPSGAWRTLHTEHFRVHFRSGDRETALRAAAEAERAYGLLARELAPPRGIVDLVLAGNVDAANGFASVTPSPRVVVFSAPPALEPSLEAYDDWLRLVSVHELTHVFHLDRSRGIWGALQAVFGRAPGLFPNAYQPSWMTEGVATYYESRFSTAGRVRGSFHTQVLAADQAAGRFRRPWDAMLFSRWSDGVAPYAYGSRFLAYLATTAGDSAVPAVMEATSGQLIPYRVGRHVRRVTGRPLAAQWHAAAPAAVEPAAMRVLARGLYQTPRPVLSPDGRRLAYLHDDWRTVRHIVVVDLATGERRARRVTNVVSFGWLGGGDTLLVAQLDYTALYQVRGDLYCWTWNGPFERLTRDARVVTVGNGGVLVVTEGGRNRLAAWRAGRIVPLSAPSDHSDWARPAASPDGRWIGAGRLRAGRWEVVRLDSTGAEVATVFRGGSYAGDVAFARDGSLWFVSDAAGLPQIYRATPAGVERLTDAPLGMREPAPGPEEGLYAATMTGDGWQLVELAGTAAGSPAEPPAAPAPPDGAAAGTYRETGYAFWASLRPHYWLPAGSTGDAGTFLGAATAGHDAVGRWTYAAVAAHAFDTGRWVGRLDVLYAGFGNPLLDLSATQDWSAAESPGFSVRVRERDLGLGLTFARRRWYHFARLRLSAEYQQDLVGVEDSAGSRSGTFEYANAVVSASAGRFLTPVIAVSLENGAEVSALYRRRARLDAAGWSDEIRGRVAAYLALPWRAGFAHQVVALRATAAMSRGPDAPFFGVGGLSTTPVVLAPGATLGERRTFPVRGFADDEVLGTRAVSLTAELRVPLALVGRGIGHLPLGVDKVHAAFFLDAGGAWQAGQTATPAELASAGAELLADLTVNYDMPTRVGLGVALPVRDPVGRRGSLYVTFGGTF